MLRVLIDTRLFRLLGGSDGTARVLRTHSDAKEETVRTEVSEFLGCVGRVIYSPTCAEHGHQAADAVVRTGGCRRQR